MVTLCILPNLVGTKSEKRNALALCLLLDLFILGCIFCPTN